MWLSMSGRVNISGPGILKTVFYLITHVFSHVFNLWQRSPTLLAPGTSAALRI